jgi:hypothetical protein
MSFSHKNIIGPTYVLLKQILYLPIPIVFILVNVTLRPVVYIVVNGKAMFYLFDFKNLNCLIC